MALAHRAGTRLSPSPSGIVIAALLAVLVAAAGCDAARPLSPPELKAYEVSLAPFGTGFALAWHGTADGRDAIYLRLADSAARPQGPAMRLTDASRNAFEPDLATVAGDLLVAWYEKDTAGALAAYAARFDRHGMQRWRRRLSPVGLDGRNAVIRATERSIWVAWLQGPPGAPPDVAAASLDASSGDLRDERTLGVASTETWNLNASLDTAGRLYVVYDARLGTRAKELQLLRYDGAVVQQTALTADDGFDSLYPDLALAGEQAALTWFDVRDGNPEVYLATGELRALGSLADERARRVTSTPGASIGAYLAWSGERLGLAWCDATGGQEEIYLQTFDVRGRALGPAGRLTDNATQSLIPAIRPWRGGFALAWTERTAGQAGETAGHAATQSSQAVLRIVE